MRDDVNWTNVAKDFEGLLAIANTVGAALKTDENWAIKQADQACAKLHNLPANCTPLALMNIEVIPKEVTAPSEPEQYLTPSGLGKLFYFKRSGKSVNLLLEAHGFQTSRRMPNGGVVWVATNTGKQYARLYTAGKECGDQQNTQSLIWSTRILSELKRPESET